RDSQGALARGVGHNYCELLATNPADAVAAAAHRTQEHIRDNLQNSVPRRVPERIVVALEKVYVDGDKAKRFAAATGPGPLACQHVQVQATVAEAGELVVVGHVVQLAIGCFKIPPDKLQVAHLGLHCPGNAELAHPENYEQAK